MWHFYDESSVSIFVINVEGRLKEIRLGLNIANGELPQALVSAVVAEGDYALVDCTVSLGFDFKDFELANREELISSFPEHSDLILNLTRPMKK